MIRETANTVGHVSLRVLQWGIAMWAAFSLGRTVNQLATTGTVDTYWVFARWPAMDAAETSRVVIVTVVLCVIVAVLPIGMHRPRTCRICQRGLNPDDWQAKVRNPIVVRMLRYYFWKTETHGKLYRRLPTWLAVAIIAVWGMAPAALAFFVPWGGLLVLYIWFDLECTNQHMRFDKWINGWVAQQKTTAKP